MTSEERSRVKVGMKHSSMHQYILLSATVTNVKLSHMLTYPLSSEAFDNLRCL